MKKPNLDSVRTKKKPIAKLQAREKVLGGDSSYINPKRKGATATKTTQKKGFLDRLFS